MAPSISVPSQIAGFFVLPIALPPLPSYPVEATHYLYLSPHQPKIPEPKAERSLFLVNVPISSTEIRIKHLLSTQLGLPAGRIEEVRFDGHKSGQAQGNDSSAAGQSLPKGKKRKRGIKGAKTGSIEGIELPSTWDRELVTGNLTAVVLFIDKSSADAVLKAVKRYKKEGMKPIWGESLEDKVPPLGSARYLRHHELTYPDKATILESVNNYMTAFAEKEVAEAKSRKKQRQEVDADGFTTVTKGGRTAPAKQEIAKGKAEQQKARQKNPQDFYRFQSREKRKEQAGELVRKFEQDKEKIMRMKERRGGLKVNPGTKAFECPPR